MKNALLWLCITLPWTCGVVLLGVFCTRAYLDGLQFEQGLHAMGWMLNMFLGAIGFLPALAVAVVVVAIARRKLQARGHLRRALLILAGSLILPFVAMPAMSASFFAGRGAAYRGLDYEGIYADCLNLKQKAIKAGHQLKYNPWADENPFVLPPSIGRLGSEDVHVTPNVVYIHIDGGGVMYHEGIGVIVAEGENGKRAFECWRGLPRLHKTLPIVLCRSYDNRWLIEDVESALKGEKD